ncbi:MAG: ATPase domain-containing protein [Candidatus Aenigmatarchaeota archaeon]
MEYAFLIFRILMIFSFIFLIFMTFIFTKKFYKKRIFAWDFLILTSSIFILLQIINIFYILTLDVLLISILFIISGILLFLHFKEYFKDKKIPTSWLSISVLIILFGIVFSGFLLNLQENYKIFYLLILIGLAIMLDKNMLNLNKEWATERIKTGIGKLDELMGGGIPPKSIVLLKGQSGFGKSTLAKQFIEDGLLRDQKCLYIAIDENPKEIREYFKKNKISTKNLIIIDAYSSRHNRKSDEEFAIEGQLDLDKLSILITDVLEKLKSNKEKRCVIDTISSLSLISEPDILIKFIQNTISKLKDYEITSILIVEEGTLEQKTLATISYMVDGIIEFKGEGSKRYIRIAKMKGTHSIQDFWEYKIKNQKILLIRKYEEEIEI